MPTILDACKPRPEILAGSFNPEVFTASLGPVLAYYRTGEQRLDRIYLNADAFFRDATHPTEGLRTTLREVFARLKGDLSVPAIHRLETGFGGGKTHTLIACTHIAYRGRDLEGVVEDVIDPALLPEPGSITVVGVAGDEIPVHRPQGTALVPYTLWGEIAFQIGGEALYREVEVEATSHAAPGVTYFERVFGGRRVLLMLDELAQYAARLEAARPDGASQLAAFLMGLHGYARTHEGIAIILTLASATDAFSRQTQRLTEMLSEVRGEEVGEDDAVVIGERAHRDVMSVTARDAVQVTPVLPHEITSVFAKRLFVQIDRSAAETVAEDYMQLYRRNQSLLPNEAVQDSFRSRMVATYPFHPTLVDFLNQKLASAENFQKTRGVLRVLALVIRHLWQTGHRAPMIHTCHLDLRSREVVEEILGRTGSSDLLFILHADVGGAESNRLESGHSNAQLLDRKNPHPEGFPLYELTWKTVFLNSLVGRQEGLASKVFGVTEQDAIFQTTFPGMTPSQVRVALESIQDSAFYLRNEQGKYFASEEPTINSVLARIRGSLTATQTEGLLQDIANKAIQGEGGLFKVQPEVAHPEDLPDNAEQPVLGVVSLFADPIDVESIITTTGSYRARQYQNHAYLLVPDTVTVFEGQSAPLLPSEDKASEARAELDGLARQVLAMRMLASNPMNYGMNPKYVETQEFTRRRREREQALQSAVVLAYRRFYFPSASGIVCRELVRSAGGEKGAPLMQQLRDILIEEGKLIAGMAPTREMLTGLQSIFFQSGDAIPISTLYHQVRSLRSWPIFESKSLLAQAIRSGVEQGHWCVFLEQDSATDHRVELYHEEHPIPLSVDILTGGYGLVTVSGAKKRGWWYVDKPVDVTPVVMKSVVYEGPKTLEDLTHALSQGETVPPSAVSDAVVELVRDGKVIAFEGTPVQQEPPVTMWNRATLYSPMQHHVLISVDEAKRRGWLDTRETTLKRQGLDSLKKLWPLLTRIESLYLRGAMTTVDRLDLLDLEGPGGATASFQFDSLGPESLRSMGSTFEHIVHMYRIGPDSNLYLVINHVQEDCPFYQELQKLGV
ncbi:MAG: DUF499 domain-containing protein [Alicyclobacillus macrosporangiidus]|uniref:ATP-binding protein n=1 Tax=Alicyclobacillus macrosporangiidus TaxID=392015 RepID=UPI0026EF7490|nr:DUF499 domain-containing protein [Alicyclobacillus macrosporangiidus]MCL6597625.1 DUF499 domain-containing protein [Alicyclobacillus macrosporangiidus]